MTIMPEEMRTEVLKFMGPTGFEPPPAIVAAVDQLLAIAVDKNETAAEAVERAILNLLVKVQDDELSPIELALVAGCMTGTLLHRLADQVRRNTPPPFNN